MAFAKLSAALLASRTVPAVVVPPEPLPPPRPAPASPPAPTAVAPATVAPTAVAPAVVAPAVVAPAAQPPEDAKQLAHHLSALKLPGFAREYEHLAQQCAAEGLDHTRFLLRLAELELSERERRRVERRIKEAHFPATKSLEGFDFSALPLLDRRAVMALARCDYIARRENVIAIGNSGTGKTHIAVALGLAACRQGFSVGFTTAAALVNELLETRAERRVLMLQKRLETYRLLIIDELGYLPLPAPGAELLFEVLSRRCERSSTLITSNLPTSEWVQVFGSERLAGALLDRLSHNIHVLDMRGDSYRQKHSRARSGKQTESGVVSPA